MTKGQFTYLLILIFVLAFVGSPSNATEVTPRVLVLPKSTLQTSTLRVLVDKSHMGGIAEIWVPDSYSPFASYLSDYNISVDTNLNKTIVHNESSVDPSTHLDLKEYDILFLAFPQEPLSQNYIDAVIEFVNDGNGLLLGGIAPKTQLWYHTPLNLNPLAENFGVQFNNDSAGWIYSTLTPDNFGAHEIWNGVDSILFDGCSLNITGEMANTIANHTKQKHDLTRNATAIAEPGSGRVLFIGSYHTTFGQIYQGSPREGTFFPNWQFILNVVNWLDQKPHQTAQQQKTFTTYLGDGPDLSQDEIDQYNLYVSSMHMHTTSGHDDGVVDPDVKMDQAEQIDLDFIIMSSHTYGMNQGSDWTTLKDGAFFMKKRAEDKGYHCICIVGSEVSGGWAHLFTFPYTEADEGRMPRSDTAAHFAEDVATIRADHDLFVGWAHPQLMYDEAFPPQSIIDWIANGSLPCDAIEMTTYAFAGSLYTQYPTYGPSDAHTYENLNNTLTYFFAKSRSEADLIDALRNRQTVALHRFNNTIYNNDPYQLCGRFAGDRVWVDELYRRIEESRTTLNMVQDEIDVKIAEGVDMTEALTKMNLAWRAFNQLSPSKAKSIAESIFAEPEEKSEKNPSWTVWIFLMSFLVLTWFNNKKNRR